MVRLGVSIRNVFTSAAETVPSPSVITLAASASAAFTFSIAAAKESTVSASASPILTEIPAAVSAATAEPTMNVATHAAASTIAASIRKRLLLHISIFLSSFPDCKHSHVLSIIIRYFGEKARPFYKINISCIELDTVLKTYLAKRRISDAPHTLLYAGHPLRPKLRQTRCGLPGSTGVSSRTEHQVLIPSEILPSRREIF